MPLLFPESQPSNLSSSTKSWVNAHCDGGARGNPGPAGYGAVLVDDAGATLAELSEFLGVRTNNVAEYAGLLAVLRWTLEHGHRRLRVTSDSLLMVKQMKGQYKVNSPDLRPMWEEARRMTRELDVFEITHALRHKNKVADRLANEAMDRGMGRGPAPGSAAAAPRSSAPVAPSPIRPATSQARPTAPPPRIVRLADERQPDEPVETGPIRGVVRDGVVRLLGGRTLAEGSQVEVVPD